MRTASRTGLTPSPTKKIVRVKQVATIQMAAIARPAPFVLKPLAGLYNPYPPRCSLLCNHPTDIDAKELIKNAKDTLNIDNKNLILTGERAGHLDVELNIGGEHLTPTNIYIPQVESVPEELFRRYTDTDSRPQTPAPTLVSGITRLSTTRTRRCFTPDPVQTCQIKEKTRLILDLRRSHSQETLSLYGSSPFYSEPPEIRIQHPPSNNSTSLEDLKSGFLQNHAAYNNNKQSNSRNVKNGDNANDEIENYDDGEAREEDDDDEFIKRRGKKRRKKTRDTAKCPITFQASVDPETQVATIGPDSHNASARQSLAPEGCSPLEVPTEDIKKPRESLKSSASLDIDSFLSKEILKQLRRELDDVVVDTELNSRRRKALEEALKTVVKGKPVCDELALLKKEMNIPPVNADLWISLPRIFSRSSAIFQLPMDSQVFDTMTPLEYVEENVKITSTRKLLYNCIFEKYKLELEDENGYERQMDSKSLKPCLDLVMGQPLTEEQFNYFKNLVEWKDNAIFGFRMCCGIFALCERLLSPKFGVLLSKSEDRCHEIETADFESLEQKLEGRDINKNLKTILYNLKSF